MAEEIRELIETLEEIGATLRALDPGDREALVHAGATLEEATADVPEEMTGLMVLVLESLQAIYEGAASDLPGTAVAAGNAVHAVARALAEPDGEAPLDHAGHVLWLALGREPGESPYYAAVGVEETDEKPQTPEPPRVPQTPSLTLDDAAVLLVQLDPGDAAGVARLREVLDTIAARRNAPSAAHQKIVAASDLLAEAPEPETLAEIGQLIEQALELMEEGMAAPDAEPEVELVIVASEEPEQPAADAPAPPELSAPEVIEFGALPPEADPAFLGEFTTECREYIQGAEIALLAIEANPGDMEAINTVFRAFHTIKGTSAFLGLKPISELAHRAESMLSRARDGEIRCTGGYADLALRSVDMLKELMQTVMDALDGNPMDKPQGYDNLMITLADPEAQGVSSEPGESTEEALRLGDILVAEGKVSREQIEVAATTQKGQPLGIALLKTDAASATDVVHALRTQQRLKATEHTDDSSVRIRTDRLDKLIEVVGELVIAQSMVQEDGTVNSAQCYELAKKVSHTGKIVRELQDLSMSMRMVPLKATFQKMARLVRDLSHKSGKTVQLITEGEDTEIDRNMVDAINDPLVHMIRNAVDHGIEAPDVRLKNGKSRAGTVVLSAYHAGGNVVVEIRDDGKGLDRNRIVEKAISRGLIESDKNMSDGDVFSLIFRPGFSTAEKVTDVSGRGVGMDVVKRGVESLKGRIDIQSQPGNGCTFFVRLPLTMAITDGMLVKVGEERYIVPTANIHISFRPEPSALSTIAGRGELVMLRNDLLPMFRLHNLFSTMGAVEDPTRALLVVVGDGDRRCALLVDELLGQQQVVAKTLGEGIGRIPGVSGGAILGDGRVGLILDTAEITALARQ